jgi:sugar (pentulose or hexulose) kinase
MHGPVVIGLDVGTQGVRAVAVREDGSVVARASAAHGGQRPFAGAVEQDPRDWWNGVSECIRFIGRDLDLTAVRAISTSSTSGTLCLLDGSGDPVRPALIYSDSRASQEAKELSAIGPLDRPVRETDALAKALWVRRHEPEVWDRVAAIRSANDFIGVKLTGQLPPFDHTQATKFGWDPVAMEWPAERMGHLGLGGGERSPVVEPGTPVGRVSPVACDALGLSTDTAVVAGATDGVCGFLACRPTLRAGCTILGTTIVWKTMASAHVADADGIYAHKGLDGSWLPGAASNSGGGILEAVFPGRDAADLDSALDLPSGGLLYPLPGHGERFPFHDPEAVSFRILRDGADEAGLFAACLEGVAYVERWGYERLESRELVDPSVGITSAGGATRSDEWLRIRASVLGRPISVPVEPGSAYGAALLAARSLGYDDPLDAAAALVSFRSVTEPIDAWTDRYDDLYSRFREAASARGWN